MQNHGQYPIRYKNQSTEILLLEECWNKTMVFDDMLGAKQSGDIDIFFTRGRHQKIDIYYILQTWHDFLQNTIRNNSSVIVFFKQTLEKKLF